MSFKSYSPKFQKLLGSDPSVSLLIEENYAFAHEAGVFMAETKELFVTSNHLYDEDGNRHVQISRVKLNNANGRTTYEKLRLPEIVMGNGGVNYRDGILFCAQGGQKSPSGLFYMPLTSPSDVEVVISSFHGRPFNSVNDVVIHSDGSIWFTDPAYGYEQGYRPVPCLPSQVYRFQPTDGSVRAMADGFGHPNGICFSPDEKIVYITDTDLVNGNGTIDETKASTIYAYDVANISGEPFLTNRRMFAMCDTGIPDGIKCDTNGNVYSGCGDGVNVWSPGGVLLGKILVQGGVANFCFGGNGTMFMLNETRLWRVQFDNNVRGALLNI